ncbi:MAG: tetratricopeptide repeat protein, partial [Phycisphaerales bacterium]
NPKLPNAHGSIAKALTALGRQEEAIAAFQKAIEISPGSALNYFLLAQQLLQRNQVTQAKQYYERAIALNPKLINAYYGLFQAHSRLQEHEQARRYLKTFKQLKTQKQQARKASILAFDDLTKTKHDTAQTYTLVGRIYLVNRMLDKAEAALSQVIMLAPQKSAGYRDLAYLLLHTGKNHPEALALAQRALSLEPTAANYFAHSRACEANGDFEGAIASLEQAVALEPDNQTYRRALDNLRERGIRP